MLDPPLARTVLSFSKKGQSCPLVFKLTKSIFQCKGKEIKLYVLLEVTQLPRTVFSRVEKEKEIHQFPFFLQKKSSALLKIWLYDLCSHVLPKRTTAILSGKWMCMHVLP